MFQAECPKCGEWVGRTRTLPNREGGGEVWTCECGHEFPLTSDDNDIVAALEKKWSKELGLE